MLSQNVQRARDLEDAIEMNNAGLPCDAYKESRPKRQKSSTSERKGVPILIGSSSEAGTSSGSSGSGGNNSERIQPRVKRSSMDLPKVLSVSASGSKEQSLVPNGVSKGLSATSHIILCFPKDSSMSYVLLNSGPMKVSDRSLHRTAKPRRERTAPSPRSPELGLLGGEALGSSEGGKGAKRGGGAGGKGKGKGKGRGKALKTSLTSNGKESLPPLGVGNSPGLMQPVDQDLQPPQSHISSASYSDTPNPTPVPGTKTLPGIPPGSSKSLPPKETSSDYDPNKFSKFANFLVNMDPLEKFGGGLGEHSGSEEEVGVYSTPMDTPMAVNDGEWEELEAQEGGFDSASDSTSQGSQSDDMEIGFRHGDGKQTPEGVMPHVPATPLSWLVPPTVLVSNGHASKTLNSSGDLSCHTGERAGGNVLSDSDPPMMESDASSSISGRQTLRSRPSSTGVEETLVATPRFSPPNPTFEGRGTHLENQDSTLPENGRVFVPPQVPTSPGSQGDSSHENDTALNLSPLNLSPTTLGHLLRSSGISESPLPPATDMGRVSQFLLQNPSHDVRTAGASSTPEAEPLSPLSRLIENMTPTDLEDATPTQINRALSGGGGDIGDREFVGTQNGIYDASERFGSVPISQTSVPNPEFTVTDIPVPNPELRVTGCDAAPPRPLVASTSSHGRAAEERTANVTVSAASAGVWTPCVSHSGSPDSIRQWLESTLTTGGMISVFHKMGWGTPHSKGIKDFHVMGYPVYFIIVEYGITGTGFTH